MDLVDLRRALHTGPVKLVTEHRLSKIFSDCDRGAIPPFGNLYGLKVYICKSLLEEDTITFNAGSHEMAIRLSTPDFEKLVKPQLLDFSHHV